MKLNARYIFDKIRNEYYANHSRNFRVKPVLFPVSGALREHLHQCLSTTIVYEYPANVEQIVKAVMGQPFSFRED